MTSPDWEHHSCCCSRRGFLQTMGTAAGTMALYHSAKTPKMLIYSGQVVRCYPQAPGGCRTNVEMTINELSDVCDVKGQGHEHLIIFYGSHVRQLKTFCRLYGIETTC